MRPSGRKNHQLRHIQITRSYIKHTPGSVLVEFGDTKVICSATVNNSIPRFLKGTNQGWLTAEYGMLPGATHSRCDREAARGKQSGRTQEIQRLIGRSLRAAVDLGKIGENTITIDCDVIQADGGTRTAAITGGCVALVDALGYMKTQRMIDSNPLLHYIASVSVGIHNGVPVLDLNYEEDVSADTDMNVVMTDKGHFVEVQGTAESECFSREKLNELITLAQNGIQTIIEIQKSALAEEVSSI